MFVGESVYLSLEVFNTTITNATTTTTTTTTMLLLLLLW